MMSSEGELASILGHELAHIQARHLQRQIDEAKVLSVASLAGMLAGILIGMSNTSGGGAGPALMAGSMAAGQSAALHYSRAHEMEADQLGFRFFCSAGYDPAEMPSIMHKMNQQKWTGGGNVPSYLSTHPALGERVLYLDEMVKKQKLSLKPVQSATGDFQIMQAALIADHTDSAKALERFQAGVKNGDKISVFGLGRFYLREDKCPEAAAQLQEAARLMPSSPYVLSTLGAAYHRIGKLQEAQRCFQSALVLDPTASIVHYRIAMVLQDLGQKKEAVDHLMQVEELAPMFPEVDYQLGIVLGQLNNLGLAHYHLGRYYMHKQNFELAMMHYKKAKAYTLDSPAKVEEVNEILRDLEKRKKASGFRVGR
jgi:predicted Zn-dependent protease